MSWVVRRVSPRWPWSVLWSTAFASALDPDQLAAFGLATTDVVQALERQNLRPDAAPAEPQPGKPLVLQITVSRLGRVAHVEELNDLVIRADTGRNVRLRDVARVELGAARPESQAQFDGKPGVALAIHLLPLARPGDVSAAVQQVTTQLAAKLPDGIALDMAFDFTANLEAPDRATSPQHVLLEMDVPPGTTAERQFAILDRADQVVRQGQAVEHVLILTDNVFDRLPDRPCLLVRVASDGQVGSDSDAATAAIRSEVEKQIGGAAFRLRDLSRPNAFPRGGYPIDFGVHGPEKNQVRSFARKLAERLRGSHKLTDVWTDAEVADRPSVQIDVNADAAEAKGVALVDVLNTVQTGKGLRDHADNLQQLFVRNSTGQMVPLWRWSRCER